MNDCEIDFFKCKLSMNGDAIKISGQGDSACCLGQMGSVELSALIEPASCVLMAID